MRLDLGQFEIIKNFFFTLSYSAETTYVVHTSYLLLSHSKGIAQNRFYFSGFISIQNSIEIGIHEVFFSLDTYNQRYEPKDSYTNEILF